MTKWKLVPVEPTPEMDNAARDWSVSKYGSGIGNDAAHGCYSAMLEAAPHPPKLSDKRLFHYAAEVRKACGPDPIGLTLKIVALLRAIEREILGGEHD